ARYEDPVEIRMGARVHIELAEEFPEDERGSLPGRLRLTDVSEHHHENCYIECHEGGDRAGRVSGFIRGDDDNVTGHGPSDRQDVQPGACATLFVFGITSGIRPAQAPATHFHPN